MEHFYQSVWLLTSMCIAWPLTMTSPSKANSQEQQSSSDSNDSQLARTSLLSLSSLIGGQRGDKCCPTGCCLNGGVCFPSSDFCQCPKQFYGYRCEKRRMRVCGAVKHLQMARLGCSLCHCFDSLLRCWSHFYSGCDDKPFNGKEEVNINDYPDDITIFPMNEASGNTVDNDYSGSNIDRDMKETNSSIGIDNSNTTDNGNNKAHGHSKIPSRTISSGIVDSDIYYYDYGDNEDEKNDNISNKSNPFSKVRTSTFGGYYWTFSMCLVLCLINWIVGVNTDIYLIS